jgi:site-specific recombinase XerD
MTSTAYVDIEKYLQTLESEIDEDNAKAIREFIDYCAAQGLSEVRQQRNAQSLKVLIQKFAKDGFHLRGASKDELQELVAALNRGDYADSTLHTVKSALKKFYKVRNGGHEEPDKTKFFSVKTGKPTTVTREELFTSEELKRLFGTVNSIRDRAMLMVFYESASRPDELLSINIGDFTSNSEGDLIFQEGSKETPN